MSLGINLNEFEKSVEKYLYNKFGILLTFVNQILLLTQLFQENKLTLSREINIFWYGFLTHNFTIGAIAIFGISALLQIIFYFLMVRQEKLYFYSEFGLMIMQALLILWNAFITSQLINLYG